MPFDAVTGEFGVDEGTDPVPDGELVEDNDPDGAVPDVEPFGAVPDDEMVLLPVGVTTPVDAVDDNSSVQVVSGAEPELDAVLIVDVLPNGIGPDDVPAGVGPVIVMVVVLETVMIVVMLVV